MNHDSFRSVVCRSLSKSLPSRSKDESHPERTECAAPFVVTLQPTICRRCESQDWSPTQSNWEERSILSQRDYLMASSLSRHFAEDLLRGAMDLQESLVMLEKFQTVSRSIRQSNKNRRPETGERSLDVTGIREALFEASIAKKVLPGSVSNRFDGQFRNSTDELKRVIKDSLYRTNDEQALLSQSARYTRNVPVVSESTKQKKVVPRSLSCTPVQPDRSKSPSLVARLMGLEGLPLNKGITAKKDETLKTVSSPRAQFDIEMPKSKTAASEKLPKQLFGKDSDHNRKARQEIMKTIQVKRILKATTSDEHKVKQQNVRMNYPYSRRDNLPSQDTSMVSELGSVKSMKREQRTVQARTKAPEHVKVVPHVTRNQHIKQVTETNRRSSNTQKHHLADRRGEGRKDTKAKAASASRTNSKLVKNHDKKLISPSSSPSSCRAMKPVLRRTPGNSRASTASSRNVRNSIIDDIVAYEVHREFIETDGASTEHSATPSDECQSADWDTDPSIDDIREDFSGSNEASSSSSPVERTISTDDNAFHPPIERALINEAKIKDEMSLLLLSDKSFLTRAAQLVSIHTYDHLIEQYQGTPKAEVKERQLYVDIAAEQIERKHRLQSSPRGTGFRNHKCRATPYFSLVALLGDISTGTRKLKSYTDNESYDIGSKDNLSVKLERDLRCTDPSIDGAWDMGWQDWMCMEETEFWARDAGEIVLSTLIEEVALEMLGW